MENRKYSRSIRHSISTPFIWMPFLSIVFADIFAEIYHRACFPLYGIPYVKRRDFIKIDRHKLKYLNTWDKLSCMYCGYVNGWLQYAAVIAGETERYWCGIKHQQREGFNEPPHHTTFAEYGDEEDLHKKYHPSD